MVASGAWTITVQYSLADPLHAVIIFYDYFLTLSQEIALVWSKQFTFVAFVFHVNRYTAFVWSIFNILAVFHWHSPKVRRYSQTCTHSSEDNLPRAEVRLLMNVQSETPHVHSCSCNVIIITDDALFLILYITWAGGV